MEELNPEILAGILNDHETLFEIPLFLFVKQKLIEKGFTQGQSEEEHSDLIDTEVNASQIQEPPPGSQEIVFGEESWKTVVEEQWTEFDQLRKEFLEEQVKRRATNRTEIQKEINLLKNKGKRISHRFCKITAPNLSLFSHKLEEMESKLNDLDSKRKKSKFMLERFKTLHEKHSEVFRAGNVCPNTFANDATPGEVVMKVFQTPLTSDEMTSKYPELSAKFYDFYKDDPVVVCGGENLIEHLIRKTKLKLNTEDGLYRKEVGKQSTEVNEDIIWRYLMSWFLEGLIRVPDSKFLYAKKSNKTIDRLKYQLYGNRYLQGIISPGKRELLNSFLDAQLNFIHLWFHETFKNFFTSSGCLSLDDDMDRYKGCRGKSKNDRKSAKEGIPSWKLVCEALFVHAIIFEEDLRKIQNCDDNTIPMNEKIAKWLLMRLEEDDQKCIVIDAGTCGCYEFAKTLLDEGHSFVISCSSNRPKWLWEWFQQTVKFWGDYSVSLCDNLKAISWRAQKLNQRDTKGKQFNILTNLEGAENVDVYHRWSKKDKEKMLIFGPEVVSIYNHLHNKVDNYKQLWSYYENINSVQKKWRVRLNVYFKAALTNCWVIWKHLKEENTSINLHDFILMAFDEIRNQQNMVPQQAVQKLKCHKRTTGPSKKRRKCCCCKSRIDSICETCLENDGSTIHLCSKPECVGFCHLPTSSSFNFSLSLLWNRVKFEWNREDPTRNN